MKYWQLDQSDWLTAKQQGKGACDLMVPEVFKEVGAIFWTSLIAGVVGLALGRVYKYFKDQWSNYKCLSAMPQPPEFVSILDVRESYSDNYIITDVFILTAEQVFSVLYI